MRTVRDILKVKGNVIWSVSPEATVYEALQLMAERDVGALVVLDCGKVVGIMSERDYARNVILAGRSSKDTPVKDIMTAQVTWVRPETTVEECMALMTNRRTRHLPVLDASRLVGVISIGDVVKSIIEYQQFTIDQLTQYVTATDRW